MTLFPIERVGEVLQEIYNSEINVSIYSEWDAGFTVKVGDEINGFAVPYFGDPPNTSTTKIDYVVSKLAHWLSVEMPESGFAEWYRGQRPKGITKEEVEMLSPALKKLYEYDKKKG